MLRLQTYNMKTLILGADGLIGSNIQLEGEVKRCTRREVDLLY